MFQKRTNFETVHMVYSSKLQESILMTFGRCKRLWDIEFACFSFHVNLLLSTFRLLTRSPRHRKYGEFSNIRANFGKVQFLNIYDIKN